MRRWRRDRPGGSPPADRALRTDGPLGHAGSALPGASSRLELAARDPRPLAPPTPPATPTEHQLGIHLHILLGLLRADLAALALLDPPLSIRERSPSALRSAQLLGQLITTRIAVELVLA